MNSRDSKLLLLRMRLSFLCFTVVLYHVESFCLRSIETRKYGLEVLNCEIKGQI